MSNITKEAVSPHQLRCDAETLDITAPGPIAADLRAAATVIERQARKIAELEGTVQRYAEAMEEDGNVW